MVTTELLLPRVWELSSQPVITVTMWPVLLPSHLRTVAHVTAATRSSEHHCYLRLDRDQIWRGKMLRSLQSQLVAVCVSAYWEIRSVAQYKECHQSQYLPPHPLHLHNLGKIYHQHTMEASSQYQHGCSADSCPATSTHSQWRAKHHIIIHHFCCSTILFKAWSSAAWKHNDS